MSASGTVVDLMSLPENSLLAIKNKTQEEYKFLSSSHEKMDEIMMQFRRSRDCVQQMKTTKEGQEIILPCHNLMGMKGKLMDVTKVIVDLGTGFFSEMPIEDACALFDRKVNLIKEKLGEITSEMKKQESLLQLIEEVLLKKCSMKDIPTPMSKLNLEK